MTKNPEKKTRLKLADLVLDYDIYPRTSIDRQHAVYMGQAYKAGVSFPPIVVDAKSKRVTDGFHRVTFYRVINGPNCKIDCIERHYVNNNDMRIDSMRMNASHGRNLTKQDRTRCFIMGTEHQIPLESLAQSLGMTVDELKSLGEKRIALCDGVQVPIKQTVKHLAGKEITAKQMEVNSKLHGMRPAFYARQLIMLADSDMLDMDDADLVETLKTLSKILGGLFTFI